MQEVIHEEEYYRFDAFSYEDAIRLSQEIFRIAENQNVGICYQIIVDGFHVIRGFLTGTDESNISWLEKKKNTVLKSRKSSLRCGMEAELCGRVEPWQSDTECYVIRGGGCPIWLENGTFVGAVCISGLQHQEDHKMAMKALKSYWMKQKKAGGERRDEHESGSHNGDTNDEYSGNTGTADHEGKSD